MEIYKETMMSHILNVRVSNEPANVQQADAIRRHLKTRLLAQENVCSVPFHGNTITASLTWKTPSVGQTGTYYYTIAAYNDEVVAAHTKLLLTRIRQEMYLSTPTYGEDWGISYLIMKPVEFIRNIQMDDVVLDN